MRLLVTGTRNPPPEARDLVIGRIKELRSWMREEDRLTIIHGRARGVDQWADEAAEMLGANVYRFPAEWRKFRRGAGPIRNLEMLTTIKPDYVLAFPAKGSAHTKSGTMHMVDAALRDGLDVEVVRI